ncbi:BT4734/BF3469 family protein [Chryseobacterium sp. M5A1_1a]
MINKIDYCTNRTITGSFQDIGKIVEFIRNPPSEHKELIEYARTLERGSEEYKKIKISKLPAITINFNFSDNYIVGKNVTESTGYLYIDVDGMTEQDLEINTTYVCAYWRSLSNTGLTLVVKVDGLTPDNFKIATQEIANALDLPFDKRAISIDRLTVLSYDPNAYYNDNVEVFSIVELLAGSDMVVEHQDSRTQFFRNTIIKDNSLIGIHCNGKIRYHDLDEVTKDMVFEYNDQGIHDCGQDKVKYHSAFMPKRVSEGSR